MILLSRSKSPMFALWILLHIQATLVAAFTTRIHTVVILTDISGSHIHHVMPVHSTNDDEELDQFDRDLLAAFGEDDKDEAVINAAYAALARDLQNVGEIDDWGKWKEDIQEGDFFITEQEAVQFYSETLEDMAPTAQLNSQIDFQVDIPDNEKQLVDDVIAAANRAMESVWKDQEGGKD
jgi:hypothetical protein